jgi:hypothetical protein
LPRKSDDRHLYLVRDNFGRLGRAWRETDEERTHRASMIADLIDGQYSNPAQVIAFNTEGLSQRYAE